MKALNITTKQTKSGKTCYTFTRNKIEYTIFLKTDCVDVWTMNNQRGGRINANSYWNCVDNQGRPMAQFLKTALSLIAA